MPTGRWDFLADSRPQPLKEFVLDQVADSLAAELRDFPPRSLDWESPAELARFREVLDRPAPPELETFRVALGLSRLELLREIETVDRFWKSPLARELLPTPIEELTALFLIRWVTESALSFQEFAQGKFKRRELVSLVERLEERMLRGYSLRL
jgi:hypothetical protein